jgi:hypothetical protein
MLADSWAGTIMGRLQRGPEINLRFWLGDTLSFEVIRLGLGDILAN